MRIVEETYLPGMSVSLVARRHGIGGNQIFTWRRLMAAKLPDVAILCRRLRPGSAIYTAATAPIDSEGLPAVLKFIMVHADLARLRPAGTEGGGGWDPMPVAHHLPLSEAVAAHRLVKADGAGDKASIEP